MFLLILLNYREGFPLVISFENRSIDLRTSVDRSPFSTISKETGGQIKLVRFCLCKESFKKDLRWTTGRVTIVSGQETGVTSISRLPTTKEVVLGSFG